MSGRTLAPPPGTGSGTGSSQLTAPVLTYTRISPNEIRLEWRRPTGAAEYRFYINGISAGPSIRTEHIPAEGVGVRVRAGEVNSFRIVALRGPSSSSSNTITTGSGGVSGGSMTAPRPPSNNNNLDSWLDWWIPTPQNPTARVMTKYK